MRPFAPNASENVIYYKASGRSRASPPASPIATRRQALTAPPSMALQVRGTRELMQRPDGPLDGMNMESFYGFIEVRHQCANWPIGKIENPSGKRAGELPSLESCEAQLDHPVAFPAGPHPTGPHSAARGSPR